MNNEQSRSTSMVEEECWKELMLVSMIEEEC